VAFDQEPGLELMAYVYLTNFIFQYNVNVLVIVYIFYNLNFKRKIRT
jgi:hypothetical protein